MEEKILGWVVLAENFSLDGDAKSMRTAAREIFDVDKNSAEGLALMAESALYSDNLDEAESFAGYALSVEPKHLRGRLVSGGVAAKNFKLRDQLKIFEDFYKAKFKELI